MPKVELMSAKERQLWYWRREMESCNRCRHIYKQGTEEYRHWTEKYENAIRTYNALSGEDLQPERIMK